jgi:hypothetical protein
MSVTDTYKRQFSLLLSQFKSGYPAYKLEKQRNIATEATSNFLNVERNVNNLFKDMSLVEAENDAKINAINKQLKKYDSEISLYKKELKREKQKLDAIIQRSRAGEQFKEQYDALKEDTSTSLYYDAFSVLGVAYLTYLVATSGAAQQVMSHH